MDGLYLILITGLPASGKSSFCRYAAERLGFDVLEKDHYKEILFDDIGFASREEKMKLGTAAMDLMYDEAARLLSRGRSVILDNNFENASLPGVKGLMAQFPCKTVTVRFEGDDEAIYKRFIARDQDPTRHRGHVLNTRYPEQGEREEYRPISLEAFKARNAGRGMKDFYPGGKLVRVDVTSFDGYSHEKLFEELTAAMHEL